MRGLKGKVAIVTGGASGIGAAIVDRLAEEGCSVVIADLDVQGGEAKAKALEAQGRKAAFVKTDVTKWEDAQHCVAETKSKFGGRVDILVNNAGWDRVMLFKDTTPDFWTKVTEINFLGNVRMCKAVLDTMSAQKSGHIINIASDAGRNGSMGEVVYSGAKGGIIGFSKGLAREVARFNITVNTVCPGPTDTPLLRNMIEKDEFAKKIMGGMENWIPLKRLAKPEEIASTVTFFASDDAGYVTGQTLSVSGGLTMM